MRFHIPEPAVTRSALQRTAALVWAIAGAVLVGRALPWLALGGPMGLGMAVAGVSLGILKSRMIFIPLAARNVERIHALSPHKERICLFAFQAIQSYLLVAAMMTAGILLRTTSIPRTILGGVYIAIGTALLLACPVYLRGGNRSARPGPGGSDPPAAKE